MGNRLFCCPGPSRIQRLRYVNEALKVVDSSEKLTESNDGTFLNEIIIQLYRCIQS